MKNLHPGARWLFRIMIYFITFWLFVIIITSLTIWLKWYEFIFQDLPSLVFTASAVLLTIIIFAEIVTRMTYNRWLYDFDDTGLRTERGIIWKKYSTVPYKRIQNVDIRRGIIARMFGFSSIFIHTAGYASGIGSEGYIPGVGVEEAEKIRSFLMGKISKHGN